MAKKIYLEALSEMLDLLQKNGSERALNMLQLAKKSQIAPDLSKDEEVEKLCVLAVNCIESLKDGSINEGENALFDKWLGVAVSGYLYKNLVMVDPKSFEDYMKSII